MEQILNNDAIVESIILGAAILVIAAKVINKIIHNQWDK